MDYFKENIDGVLAVTVNLNRASFLDSSDFLEILENEIIKGARKLVIDLKSCSYIDPVFLNVIIVSLRKLVAIEGNIKLVKPSLSETNFNLIHALRIFDIYDSKKEAVKSYSKTFAAPSDDYLPIGNALQVSTSLSF